MSRKENAAESTGSGAEQASTNGHNGFVIDLPADYGKRAKVNERPPGEHSPYPDRSATVAEEAAKQRVKLQRIDKYRSRRYALRGLDGRTEPWARKIAADFDNWNARRDPTKDTPVLMFSGEKAVKVGMTDAQIEALTELTNGEVAALRFEATAVREDCRIQAREAGQSLAAQRRNLNPVRDRWMTLDELAEMPAPVDLIPTLMCTGTLDRWFGMSGTLKSFLALDAALSLATATPFLGVAAVRGRGRRAGACHLRGGRGPGGHQRPGGRLVPGARGAPQPGREERDIPQRCGATGVRCRHGRHTGDGRGAALPPWSSSTPRPAARSASKRTAPRSRVSPSPRSPNWSTTPE